MSLLSQLPKTISPRKKRLGRGTGSAKGAKSGRGTTRHQASRENIPLSFEGGQGRMVKRYPLLRGKGKNNSFHDKYFAIQLKALNIFADGDEVTFESLVSKGLVRDTQYPVKILRGGRLTKKVILKVPVSTSAKSIVEKLGGKVEA